MSNYSNPQAREQADRSESQRTQTDRQAARNDLSGNDAEDEPVEDDRLDEDDDNVGEEEEEGNQSENQEIHNFLLEMQMRIKKAEEERDQAQEENHQLRLKLKEVLTVNPDAARASNQKIQSQLDTLVKSLGVLEKDNMQLRSELKGNLEEKLLLFQKMQKYDSIVEELKQYNSELIEALKQSEQQITLIKEQKSFSSEEIDKIRSEMDTYQKKFEEIEVVNRELEEERQKNLEVNAKYQDMLQENTLLKEKLVTMGHEMDKIRKSVNLAFQEEDQTKTKIRDLVTSMHGQLQDAQRRILEKEEENMKLLLIIKQIRDGGFQFGGQSSHPATEKPDPSENTPSSQQRIRSIQPPTRAPPALKSSDERQTYPDEEEGEEEAEEEQDQTEEAEEPTPQQRRSNLPDKKKKDAGAKASRDEEELKMSTQSAPMHASGLKKSSSKQKIDILRANILQEQMNTFASQKSKAQKEAKPKPTKEKLDFATKFLNTIVKSKQRISKIESDQLPRDLVVPQPPKKARPAPQPAQEEQPVKEQKQKPSKPRRAKKEESESEMTAGFSAKERQQMQSKLEMISQMNTVLSEFEKRIHLMKTDMSNLIGK